MAGDRPRVGPESEHWYTDKLTGARISFQPKEDELVVTFTEPVAAVMAAPQVRSLSRGVNAERGFAVIHQAAGQGAAEVAASVDGIANAVPVFVDPEGLPRYFLPDELTVQFTAGVDSGRAEEIIAREGSRVLVRQRTPGYYTVSVAEGGGLFETIRRFAGLPEVAFAEPSEAGFDDLLYVPDDTDFSRLWGMRNTGQTVNGTVRPGPGRGGKHRHRADRLRWFPRRRRRVRHRRHPGQFLGHDPGPRRRHPPLTATHAYPNVRHGYGNGKHSGPPCFPFP